MQFTIKGQPQTVDCEMKKYSMQSFGAQFCEVRVNEVPSGCME
jgi:hypothetical protein